MKTIAIAFYFSVAAILSSTATEKVPQITEMDLKALDFELPTSIRLRAELAALQRPEFIKSMKELGLGSGIDDSIVNDSRAVPSSSVSVLRAWDGVVFLKDNHDMALWVRANNDWKCVVAGLRIDKTMGGAPPVLPVRYLGGGFFAITETVPGEVVEKSQRGFPQALAVTFLIDSNGGKVKERSQSFIYDHNPPVRVPESWIDRYKLNSEQAGSSNGG